MPVVTALPRLVFSGSRRAAAAQAHASSEQESSSEAEGSWTKVSTATRPHGSILKASPASATGPRYFQASSDSSSVENRVEDGIESVELSPESEEGESEAGDCEDERSWTEESNDDEDLAPAAEASEESDPEDSDYTDEGQPESDSESPAPDSLQELESEEDRGGGWVTPGR